MSEGCFATCSGVLRMGIAPVDVTVSTLPPLVAGPYTVGGFVCPHGVTYWMEPTGEQVAEWIAEGEE